MANEIINTKVTESEWNRVKIIGASTRPNAKSAYGNGLSASDTKEMFDAPSKLLVDKHNALVDILDSVERIREENEAERAEAEEQRQINEYGAAGNRYDSGLGCVVDADGVEVDNVDAGRVGAELEREAAENERKSEEIIRINAENIRSVHELERNSAENTRVQEEMTRNGNEWTRMNNEGDRKSAEETRVENEKNRVAKDAERDGKIAKIETLVGDIDTALNSILASQESLIGGEA